MTQISPVLGPSKPSLTDWTLHMCRVLPGTQDDPGGYGEGKEPRLGQSPGLWPFHVQAVTSCEPSSPSHRSLVALTLGVLNPKRGPRRWGWQPHTPLDTQLQSSLSEKGHQPARHHAQELLWAPRAGTELRQSGSGGVGEDHRRGCPGSQPEVLEGIGLHPELMVSWEGC